MMEVFQKEASTLELAQEALANSSGMSEQAKKTFQALVKAYARLLRQSRRMVTMGDRIQHALNELNAEVTASESKYRGVFENVNEGIYRCAPDGSIIEVNPAMASMFGFSDGDAFLASISNLQELFCSRADYDRYQSLLDEEGVHRHEVRACGPGDINLWAEISASVMFDEQGENPTGVVGVLADVTEQKHMLEEMCRLARTDSLTNLWNRGYFMELAGREVTRSLRNGGALSLLIADVDFFKTVNDTFGHDVGDQVLIALADVLRQSVREVDIVGRLGGEEFVVLLPDANLNEAMAVSERVAEAVRNSVIECHTAKVPLTISIGMTSLHPGDDLDAILKFADIALYAAKKKGRDRVEIYQRDSQTCDIGDCPRLVDADLGGGQ